MDYGNIIYILAFSTLAIVLAVLAFSYFRTKKKQKEQGTDRH